jgi:hypothetical protein
MNVQAPARRYSSAALQLARQREAGVARHTSGWGGTLVRLIDCAITPRAARAAQSASIRAGAFEAVHCRVRRAAALELRLLKIHIRSYSRCKLGTPQHDDDTAGNILAGLNGALRNAHCREFIGNESVYDTARKQPRIADGA